jgi:hypothetical protein
MTIVRFAAYAALIFGVLSPAHSEEPQSCSNDSDCAQEQFCDTTPSCPGEGVIGVCKSKPQICTMDYQPVMGCNGKQYSNACAAAGDGQANTGLIDE